MSNMHRHKSALPLQHLYQTKGKELSFARKEWIWMGLHISAGGIYNDTC